MVNRLVARSSPARFEIPGSWKRPWKRAQHLARLLARRLRGARRSRRRQCVELALSARKRLGRRRAMSAGAGGWCFMPRP